MLSCKWPSDLKMLPCTSRKICLNEDDNRCNGDRLVISIMCPLFMPMSYLQIFISKRSIAVKATAKKSLIAIVHDRG